MGELAPVSIAAEWQQLVVNLETAAAFDPSDPESEQEVVAMAYATEAAAYEVWRWLDRNCGLRLPITTIAPHELAPARDPAERAGPDDHRSLSRARSTGVRRSRRGAGSPSRRGRSLSRLRR